MVDSVAQEKSKPNNSIVDEYAKAFESWQLYLNNISAEAYQKMLETASYVERKRSREREATILAHLIVSRSEMSLINAQDIDAFAASIARNIYPSTIRQGLNFEIPEEKPTELMLKIYDLWVAARSRYSYVKKGANE